MKKVLIYDIETSYVMARIWRAGRDITVNHDQVCGDFLEGRSRIICVAYKWAHEKQTHIMHSGLRFEKEAQLIERFDKIVGEADVVLAHNGDHFDMKHFNTGRLLHGLPPVMWPTSEDTLKILRKNFNLPSNRLDYVAKRLIGKGKDVISFEDWVKVIELRDKAAREKMFKYCKRDVVALDAIAKIIMPYVTTTLSRASARKNLEVCSNILCGKSTVIKFGYHPSPKGKVQKYRCNSCGHVHIGNKVV